MTTPRTHQTTTDAVDTGWRDRGACLQVDADLFFPVAHTAHWKTQIRDAKAVCARCEVREACLDWALDTAQPTGVWGGKSTTERRALRGSRESQMRRCRDRQAWIEEQLAAHVSQMAIAARLRVARPVLAQAVALFKAERAAGAGVTV